jgi:hypothetical protein
MGSAYDVANEPEGADSDDISRAMTPFIHEIDKLSKLDNPKALEEAYDLLNMLRQESYGDLDSDGGGYGDRPSDEPADRLLARLIRERTEAGEVWDWGRDLKDIQGEGEELADYGIEPWFPETQKALKDIQGEGEELADYGIEPWSPETQKALEDLCAREKQQVTEDDEALKRLRLYMKSLYHPE